MNNLTRSKYNSLSINEKQELLKKISEKHKMRIKEFSEFSRWGQSTYTAIYEYEDSEFVFVPGDTVTLGWEGFVVGMDEKTQKEIQRGLDDFEIKTPIEELIKSSTSPIRKVEIMPMLVERKLHEIGLKKVYIKELDMELRTNTQVSYGEFVKGIIASKFRLPTEDEWEYLCGGGVRTLFPWGDSFDYTMHIYHFDKLEDRDKPYDMKEPNMFGISIAYDPYKKEIVMDSSHFYKGGDGGGGICGGIGIALGYLPCSPHYIKTNSTVNDDESFNIGDGFNFYRRIIHVEI